MLSYLRLTPTAAVIKILSVNIVVFNGVPAGRLLAYIIIPGVSHNV